MKKAVLPLVVVATCAVFFAVLWAAGWIKPPTQNTPETKKPQELILGKWEGINSQGSPIGMEFNEKGVLKIYTRVTAKTGDKTNDGPFTVTATYKFVDDDMLEAELAFGKIQTIRSKVVVTQDELTITPENKEPQKYKRVKEFSSELTKPSPGSSDDKSSTAVALKPTLTFKGHKASVESVAFSPDEALVASGGDDGVVILWERATGAVKYALDSKGAGKGVVGEKTVTSVAFSPDGSTIACTSGVGVKLWSVQTGEARKAPPLWGKHIAFSPDGSRLLVGGNGKVQVWDLVQDKEIVSTKQELNSITSMTVSRDGKWIATGDLSAYAKVWDATTGEQKFSYKSSGGQVFSVALSPDSGLLAADLGSIRVKLFDVAKGDEITLKGEMAKRTGLSRPCFLPDGKHLACVERSEDLIGVWDYWAGQQRLILKGHTGPVKALAASHDGKWIVSASQDHRVNVWDISSVAGPPIKSDTPKIHYDIWRKREVVKELYQLEFGEGTTDSLGFSPDGQRLATSGGQFDKRSFVVWDMTTRKQIKQVTLGQCYQGRELAFGPDANKLFVTTEDKLQKGVQQWDVAERDDKGRFFVYSPDQSASCTLLAISNDRKLLAAGGYAFYSKVSGFDKDKKDSPGSSAQIKTGMVAVWDVASGERRFVLKDGLLNCDKEDCNLIYLRFSPDGRWLLGVHHDRQITFWSTADGKEEKTIRVAGNIKSISLDPKGRFISLVSGSSKHSELSILDVMSWQERKISAIDSDEGVQDAVFTPDGQYLVSVGARGMIWEPSTGVLLKEFDTGMAQKGVPRRLVFHPEGKFFATSGPYRSTSEFGRLISLVQIWGLDSEALSEIKREKAGAGQIKKDTIRMAIKVDPFQLQPFVYEKDDIKGITITDTMIRSKHAEIRIEVNGGVTLNETGKVTITSETPKLTFTPRFREITATTKQVTFTVVGPEVAYGRHRISVTGFPTNTSTSFLLQIEADKKREEKK